MMNANQVGQRLVELCKAGNFTQAVDELYAAEIVSVEATAPPGKDTTMSGLAAVRGKNEWWITNHEVHESKVDGPWPNGDRFIVRFDLDVTPKTGPMKGKRMQMKEAGLYTVKDGKVVHEEFYYSMG